MTEVRPSDVTRLDLVRRRPSLAFVTLAFALSWSWWGIADIVLAGTAGLPRLVLLPGGFGPAIAAVIVLWATGSDVREWLRRVVRWRMSPRWYLMALAVPVTITAGATVAFSLASIPIRPAVLPQRALVFPLILVGILLVGGGQEEPGWRGFLLPRLQARYTALTASLIVGIVWALWHLPLFLMGAARNASGSFGIYLVMVLAVSILLTAAYNASGSVLIAALAHAGVNASSVLLPLTDATAAAAPLAVDIALAVVLWVMAVGVVAWHGPTTLCGQERMPETMRTWTDEAIPGTTGTAD